MFESGFSADSLAWTRVQALEAPRRRSCAYDRAGSGFSDPGPLPRDGAAIARDLDRGIRAAGLRGPFILVGHSAGGLYARLFANLRPKDVVGMVLVDPSVEHQDRRMEAEYGAGAGSLAGQRSRVQHCLAWAQAPRGLSSAPVTDPPPGCGPRSPSWTLNAAEAAQMARAQQPDTWKAQLSELDTLWTATSDEIDAGRMTYGRMPLIVLTAGNTYAKASEPGASRALSFWRGLHSEIAARSSRGAERLVPGASHLIMIDRPEAVADAIEDVAKEALNDRPQ